MKTSEMLKGLLENPVGGMRIGFKDGCFVLAIGEGESYEEFVSHEDWGAFLELCSAYSDYTNETAYVDETDLMESKENV